MSDNNQTPIDENLLNRDTSIDMNKLLSSKQLSAKKHGDVVELEDGTSGIVVERDAVYHEIAKKVTYTKLHDYVNDTSTPVYEKLSGDVPPDTVDYGERVIQQLPDSDYAKSIMEVKQAFSGFDPSIKGLAPTGSKESNSYADALAALRSGEYVLPTVSEYRKQKEELEKRRQEERIAMETQTNQSFDRSTDTPTHEPRNVAKYATAIDPASKEPQAVNPATEDTTPTIQQAPRDREPKVVNLAEMEARYEQQQKLQEDAARRNAAPMPDREPQSQITEFKVPEGRVAEFLDTLPKDKRDIVETAKTIRVEEERMVKVPVATRTITSMDQYKRIAKKKVTSEAVEVPMLNSGYVAVVKGCGSLEMATILPNVRDMEWEDYAKLYNFCYKQLVSTSIGMMSFRDFQIKTSPYDLDAMVHAILRASLPDENGITLTCGGDNCGKDYDIKYSLSGLTDWDSVTQEIIQRIDELINAKKSIEDAKAIQEKSPVMLEKYVDVGDGRTVVIKSPNGPMIIERTDADMMQRVADNTSPITAIFLLNIKSIFVDMPDEEGELQTYELTDLEVIANELQTFSDTQLEIIKDEMQSIKVYDQYTYSFKGENGHDIVCPHCGYRNKTVPCKVQQLVFHRVSRAMN